MTSFKKYLHADSGVAAIEMSFILPFLLLLYFGLLDLTGLVSFNRKITSVASSIADLIGQNKNQVELAEIQDYFFAIDLIMKPTPPSSVSVNVFGYRLVGGTVVKIWQTSNGKGPGCTNSVDTAGMAALMAAGNDLIVAQACMKYKPYVTNFLGDSVIGNSNFNVEQIVTVRPRSSLVSNCYTTSAATTLCS